MLKNRELLWEQVLKITDKDMMVFTTHCILKLPKYSLVPSSRSGKYHPIDEFRIGGQALHVSRVVRTMEHLLERDGETDPKVRDLMVMTAILHDVNKAIDARSEAAGPEFIKAELTSVYGELWPVWGKHLVELITVHGGRWTPMDAKYRYNPNDKFHMWIHTADYIASRNDIKYTDDICPHRRIRWLVKLNQRITEWIING